MSDQIDKRLSVIESKLDKILELLESDTSTSTSKKTKTSKKISAKKIIIKKGNCTLNVYKDALLIGGNTFDRRDLIKGFGSRWNPEHKGWTVSVNKLEHVKEELEKYFESVTYNTSNKYKNLIAKNDSNQFGDSEEDKSFGSNNGCVIESDSD